MYEGEDGDTGKGTDTRTEGDEKISTSKTPSQSLQQTKYKTPLTASKKEERKTAVEYELNSSKNCSEDTKQKSGRSSTKLRNRMTSHQKSWRKIRIQVIYKKGDREDAGNYRPICSLPVLYKLFATALYARLAPSLHKIQPPDHGGFRPNHRCDDHLMVYRVLEQRCRDWGVPLYISTIDFTIAFDRIKHSALWSSLQFYGVEPAYVGLLQRLYSQQEGTVLTDKESDIFPIKRERNRGTHCPPYSSTQYCNFPWRVT